MRNNDLLSGCVAGIAEACPDIAEALKQRAVLIADYLPAPRRRTRADYRALNIMPL